MCEDQNRPSYNGTQTSYSHLPEDDLAMIIYTETGIITNGSTLRRLIRDNWRSVSTLAHRIHEGR